MKYLVKTIETQTWETYYEVDAESEEEAAGEFHNGDIVYEDFVSTDDSRIYEVTISEEIIPPDNVTERLKKEKIL